MFCVSVQIWSPFIKQIAFSMSGPHKLRNIERQTLFPFFNRKEERQLALPPNALEKHFLYDMLFVSDELKPRSQLILYFKKNISYPLNSIVCY